MQIKVDKALTGQQVNTSSDNIFVETNEENSDDSEEEEETNRNPFDDTSDIEEIVENLLETSPRGYGQGILLDDSLIDGASTNMSVQTGSVENYG